MLVVYVDDMIISNNIIDEIDIMKHKLLVEFDINSLVNLRYFLATEVPYSKKKIDGIIISPTYVLLEYQVADIFTK